MAKTGQIVAATAGTYVQGPNESSVAGFLVTFPATNTGAYGYINGNISAASDAASTDSYILEEGKSYIVPPNTNLNTLWFTGASNGDLFAWIVL
jgi:hypothetical protein